MLPLYLQGAQLGVGLQLVMLRFHEKVLETRYLGVVGALGLSVGVSVLKVFGLGDAHHVEVEL